MNERSGGLDPEAVRGSSKRQRGGRFQPGFRGDREMHVESTLWAREQESSLRRFLRITFQVRVRSQIRHFGLESKSAEDATEKCFKTKWNTIHAKKISKKK